MKPVSYLPVSTTLGLSSVFPQENLSYYITAWPQQLPRVPTRFQFSKSPFPTVTTDNGSPKGEVMWAGRSQGLTVLLGAQSRKRTPGTATARKPAQLALPGCPCLSPLPFLQAFSPCSGSGLLTFSLTPFGSL